MKKSFIYLILIILISTNAYGYIGPGIGLGLLLTVAGFIFSILVFIVAILWYPIKKIINKNKKERK